jgi:tetratricopeptide (TPR) repeat protein
MSRQEKRYFKLYAARHTLGGKNINLVLFDAIAAMEEYDEQEIHRRFSGQAFLTRFTVTKHRLYDTLLASLEAFHADSSVDARLNHQMHRVEILYQRGLYADAEKVLKNAKLLSEQHGKTHVLLHLSEWERRLMERLNYEGVREAHLRALAERADKHLHELEHQERLWQLKSRSFMLLYRQGKARSEHGESAIRELMRDPVLKEEGRSTTPRARFLRHHILSAIAFSLNDMLSCEDHLDRNDRLLQAEGPHFQDEPNLALSVLSNLAYVRLRLGRYPEALECVKRFKRLPPMLPEAPSQDLELKVFAMGTSLELATLCRSGEFEKAMERLAAVEEGLKKFAERLSVIRKAGLCFQSAWACFGAGRYDRAAHWCRDLLNEKGIEQHEEMLSMGRLLELLILLETGKTDLLNYAVRNVERFLRSHRRQFRFERAMLAHVKARMRTKEPSRTLAAHSMLVAALSALETDPREQAVFDHLDPLCYALAKQSGRAMAEVAKERAEKGRALPKPTSSGRKAA